MLFLGTLTTSLCERYGCRIVAITGTFFCIAGLIFSSFVKSLPVLFFTFGIIWGAGTSLCYFPTVIVLSKYFKTRLSLVNGIVCSGSGVGTLTMGPFVQLLLSRLGLSNGLRAIAAMLTVLILCGATFRPVPVTCSDTCNEGAKQRKRKKFFDWEIFKNKGYVVWSACHSIYMLGYFVPFVHLVSQLLFFRPF
jgi:MCP family monocarboxylic acid transporter-like MFS transporter 10